MTNKINKKIATNFEAYLNKQLENKDFKNNFEKFGVQLEIAYQIAKLRKNLKMSQKEFAQKIGTTQSNVARTESGKGNFTIGFLSKIAHTFNKELKIRLE